MSAKENKKPVNFISNDKDNLNYKTFDNSLKHNSSRVSRNRNRNLNASVLIESVLNNNESVDDNGHYFVKRKNFTSLGDNRSLSMLGRGHSTARLVVN